MKRTMAALGLLLVLGGCTSNDVTGNRRVIGSVGVVFVATPARVEVGKNVRFTLRLTNTSGLTTTLTSPTSQHYDFWVTDGDEEVWRWSDDRVFQQTVTTLEIGPQETTNLTADWKTDTAGTFGVHGLVTAEGYGSDLRGEVIVG